MSVLTSDESGLKGASVLLPFDSIPTSPDPFSLPRFLFIADSPFWAGFFLRSYTSILRHLQYFTIFAKYLYNPCGVTPLLFSQLRNRFFNQTRETPIDDAANLDPLIWILVPLQFLFPFDPNLNALHTQHATYANQSGISKFYHLFTNTSRLTLSILHCCLPPCSLLCWFLLHSQFHHFYRILHIISLQTLLSSYEIHC